MQRPCAWLVALTLAVGVAAAQEPRPTGKVVIVSVGGTQRLQMSTKQPIRRVVNDRPDVVRVEAVADDPTTVLLIGLSPGAARITLTGADGTREVRRIGKPAPPR